MSDFPGALDLRTSHYGGWSVPFQPRFVIVHGTAGFQTAQEVATYFQANTPPTSVHYVVGRDGVIAQCVAESEAAWGNGVISGPAGVGGDGVHHDAWWDHSPDSNPNTWTFSIEHVKPSSDNSDILTSAQQDASFRLIAHLCAAHGIPARAADANGGITGHYSIDPVNRSRCPGPYPWQELWSYLAATPGGSLPMSIGIPHGWTDSAGGDATNSAGVLSAPNGVHVVLGFRAYILTHEWDASDWPLGPQQHLDPVEVNNSTTGPGDRLVCRRTMLAYTPAQGVFVVWLGQELLDREAAHAATQRALTAAAAANVSLQQQLATASKLPAKAQAALTICDAVAAYTKLP